MTLLAFISYYVFAGAYSETPEAALQFKGLLLLAVLAGVVLVGTFERVDDVRFLLRICTVATSAFVFIIAGTLIANPSKFFLFDRLQVLGLNANRIGLEAAAAFLMSFAVALHDRSFHWRVFAGVSCALSVAVILATGSRGAVGMSLVGFLVIGAPVLRRPVLLAFVLGCTAIILNLVLDAINPDAAKRLGEVNFDTREGVWSQAMAAWQESPIVGIGWIGRYTPGGRMSGVNLHSIFWQTLAEIGILGFFALCICIFIIIVAAARMYRATLWVPAADRAPVYVALAFVLSTLLHGVVESATLQGATANCFVLALGVGLLDRLPRIYEASWAASAEAASSEIGENAADDYAASQSDPAHGL
ncbi:MAG: O-antigen ligase family protein [Phycisphaeraceae bacterium]|nr:O-antigen ligase family protein [Phycisphaeraceae bacterium]